MLFSISINLTDSAGSLILGTSVGDSLAARCIVAIASGGRPDVANQRETLGDFCRQVMAGKVSGEGFGSVRQLIETPQQRS